MPIDIQKENVISLAEAARTLPRVHGKRPAISTLWRWCRKGLNGVQLEYVRVGRNIGTTIEALNRFFSALADADVPPTSPPELLKSNLRATTTSRTRERSLAEADRILAEAGI
jgi:hypothetical protein